MLSTLQALRAQHIFVSHTHKHTCDRSHALFQPNVVTPDLEDGSRRPVPSDYANRYSSANLEAEEKTQEAKDETRKERRRGEAGQDRSAEGNDEEDGKKGEKHLLNKARLSLEPIIFFYRRERGCAASQLCILRREHSLLNAHHVSGNY
ncbi:hypothetical protein B9Z55_023240 [Caenorhabditis nigoni]|uniref:Uncharacterized protein n=1 Tax=Caenorhabditis nigoni TaxID=1611254 RepID=A0A2G5SNS2_9PELO|nr:hypothetical protein B9Z55_023240 [Caenorhabditis nigoni]